MLSTYDLLNLIYDIFFNLYVYAISAKFIGWRRYIMELLLISGLLMALSCPVFASAKQVNPDSNKASQETTVTSKTEVTTKTTTASTSDKADKTLSPSAALKRLEEGNERFAQDRNTGLDRNQARRAATVSKQLPFAIIMGCSDSRVPPEIAFDQGIGDLFVVRVAGNVVSDIELASIEYSALVNHSSIVVVLGHQNCGAVDAVVKKQTAGFEAITKFIEPSIRVAQQKPDFDLRKGIEANILNSVRRVKASPVIQNLIVEKKIDVVGGYYNLDTGKVELLESQS